MTGKVDPRRSVVLDVVVRPASVVLVVVQLLGVLLGQAVLAAVVAAVAAVVRSFDRVHYLVDLEVGGCRLAEARRAAFGSPEDLVRGWVADHRERRRSSSGRWEAGGCLVAVVGGH